MAIDLSSIMNMFKGGGGGGLGDPMAWLAGLGSLGAMGGGLYNANQESQLLDKAARLAHKPVAWQPYYQAQTKAAQDRMMADTAQQAFANSGIGGGGALADIQANVLNRDEMTRQNQAMQVAQGQRQFDVNTLMQQAQGMPNVGSLFGMAADPISKYMQWRQMQQTNQQAQQQQAARDQMFARAMGGRPAEPQGQAFGNWGGSGGGGQAYGGSAQGSSQPGGMMGYEAFGSPGPGNPADINMGGGSQSPY